MGACTGRKVYLEKPELEDPVRRKLMGMVEQERESRFYTMEMNERELVEVEGDGFSVVLDRLEWFLKNKLEILCLHINPIFQPQWNTSSPGHCLYSSTLRLDFSSPWYLSCQCPFLSQSTCWSPAHIPELSKSLLQNSQLELIFLTVFQLYTTFFFSTAFRWVMYIYVHL